MSGPRIAITLGDPAGIGPEIVVDALWDSDLRGELDLVVVGARQALQRLDGSVATLESLPVFAPDGTGTCLREIEAGDLPGFGEISAAGGRHAGRSLEAAIDLVRAGSADALVTAPLGKAALRAAGYTHTGHTPFLAERDGVESVFMLFETERFSVVLVTDHIPLSQVPVALTTDRTVAASRLAGEFLRKRLGRTPRIALAGLNPHAGEGGTMGEEEQTVLVPAIDLLRGEGWSVEGPYPGDTIYRRAREGAFDLVVSPYHDQGLAAIKTSGLGESVHYTLGLSFLRASVDHGTAYDIAGKGVADPGPLIRAVRAAAEHVRQAPDH